MRARAAAPQTDELSEGIEAALVWLDRRQDADGYWMGMLDSNSCMEAEWLMAFHLLGIDYPQRAALCRGILERQRDDGAWETFHDAPAGDVNTSVECYVALRINGHDPDSRPMRRAREWITRHQGMRQLRVFTRYWLAMLGEWPWERTPNLPPEIIRLPRRAPFNIYRFAAWARATLVPLAVLSALRLRRPLPETLRPRELFEQAGEDFDFRLPRHESPLSWEGFFLAADRMLHGLQSAGLTPARRGAISRCLEWIIRHQDADGAWGGIQPPWIYSLLALNAAGYPTTHPVIARGLAALETHWSWQRGGARYIQASESPVWDTLLALAAMQDSGRDVRHHSGMQRAVDWLLEHECRDRGDWSVRLPGTPAGGWAFQHANLHYPDSDDTAVALLVLARLDGAYRGPEVAAAMQRGRAWLLAMQSDNGGWGAFDRNNEDVMVTRIPFADFGEVLDPPSVDVTAHAVEALAALGMRRDEVPLRRALDFIHAEQEADGSWFGRWGVNHIYGTGAVLPALAAAGEDPESEPFRRAAAWLCTRQNADGGWGETCSSYMQPELAGYGPSTASQTAWALMGLIAAGAQRHCNTIESGVAWLLRTQREGSWEECHYTGTGFPGYGVGARLADRRALARSGRRQGPELARAFMINYHLYRHYFPLMALARGRAQRRRGPGPGA